MTLLSAARSVERLSYKAERHPSATLLHWPLFGLASCIFRLAAAQQFMESQVVHASAQSDQGNDDVRKHST